MHDQGGSRLSGEEQAFDIESSEDNLVSDGQVSGDLMHGFP